MEPLVSPSWLAEQLTDPSLRVLECTVNLLPAADGRGYTVQPARSEWETGHIPRSSFADLAGDLSDPDSRFNFTLPTPERFGAAMERLGVGQGTRVVLYDRGFTMWATRLWWMLRTFGFDDAAVLDGGWAAWIAAGGTVSTDDAPQHAPARFVARPRTRMIASKADVLAGLGQPSTCIVNALSPEQHRGEDLRYGRAGHIPGATNVYAVSLLDRRTNRYRPVSELRDRFAEVLDRPRVITYCGGGIAATSDAFVLHALLGHPDVAVYDGSLSEWTQDPEAPLEV